MHTNWCVLIEISMEIGMINFLNVINGAFYLLHWRKKLTLENGKYLFIHCTCYLLLWTNELAVSITLKFVTCQQVKKISSNLVSSTLFKCNGVKLLVKNFEGAWDWPAPPFILFGYLWDVVWRKLARQLLDQYYNLLSPNQY